MDSITTVRSEKQERELAHNRLANLLFVSWAETALVARFTYFETNLLVPSSITYHASTGDKNQLQVLLAGQEEFE